MMFIAQLKTAALITAACVVVAGGGVIVAKEMLTPPATPATVQAEPKGLPPPTPATNDTTTIAWGAVTNELQAGLVPLGGMKEPWGNRTLYYVSPSNPFECPNCVGKPVNLSMLDETAAEKRVCRVCGAPKPWGAAFVAGEPLRLEVHLKNTDKEACTLCDARWGSRWGERWGFTFTTVNGGTIWYAQLGMPKFGRTVKSFQESEIPLAAGQQNAVVFDLGDERVSFADSERRAPSVKTLPPGKYTVTATYAHREHAPSAQDKPCPYWHGTVTTGPVEIEIKSKHAIGSQLIWTAHAELGAAYEKAVKLLGRNGFSVIRNAAEAKVFMDRMEQAGIKVEESQIKRSAIVADFTQSMQVVCWRDLHSADSLRITGVQQTAGGGSGKRDKFRLDLEVDSRESGRNVPSWKACCVWIPRVACVEVPGIDREGKEVIWTADDKGRDVADGLQACLNVEKTSIKPGDDITLTMTLRNVGRTGWFRVWDNEFSEGYRADFYLVITPDGQSRILRRVEQEAWNSNWPTPIAIPPGKSWTLGVTTNRVIVKSLKSLGLDTSKPGIYTITGYYEAGGRNRDGVLDNGCQFWGGQIATPPVEVRVGATNAPAAKVTEADARRIALAKATDLYPKWQEHHDAKYGDPIRKPTLADGIWTVEFSADNGLNGWSATIRIDAQSGKVLSAEVHPSA